MKIFSVRFKIPGFIGLLNTWPAKLIFPSTICRPVDILPIERGSVSRINSVSDLDLQIRKAYNLSVKAAAKLKIGSFSKINYLGSYEIFILIVLTLFRLYLVFL